MCLPALTFTADQPRGTDTNDGTAAACSREPVTVSRANLMCLHSFPARYTWSGQVQVTPAIDALIVYSIPRSPRTFISVIIMPLSFRR